MRVVICLLFVFVVSCDAARLKPLISSVFSDRYTRDDGTPNELKPGGAHVCAFEETVTRIDTVQTTVQKVRNVKVCCKKFMWCWKKCLRPETYYVTDFKKVSKQYLEKRYHCCEGWSYNSKENDCSLPVCVPRCFNGGFCDLAHHCDCSSTGFNNTYCQDDIDECSWPGKNNCTQVCNNVPGSYYCSCKDGFEPKDSLNQNCENINECKSRKDKACKCAYENENFDLVPYNEAGRPQNCTAMCNDTQGSFSCSCSRGFELLTDNLCVDVDECLDPMICPEMSVCTNLPGSYRCDCISGFEKVGGTGGERCKAIDFCAKSNGGCEQGCVPISGSYICTCEFGFYLSKDQHKCIDINECESSQPCDLTTSVCVNTVGNYYCKCKDNFKMDNASIVCEDIDECQLGSAKCEQKCINTYGGYECACNEGFKLAMDGHKCEDINECEMGTHFCSQQCINTPGSYSCACNAGYILDANKWVCHPSLCAEIMAPGFGEVFCDGYVVGKTCDFKCNQGYEISGPKERVCQTNGAWSGSETTCIPKNCPKPNAPPDGVLTLPCDLSYGSSCPVSCVEGYILRGRDMIKCDFVYNRLSWDMRYTKCEEILVCKPNPCKNGGRCSIVTDTEYSCNCTNTGHAGRDCEQLVVDHAPIPKLKVNIRSPKLTITSKPVRSVHVEVYTSNPGVKLSKSTFDIKQPYTTLEYTIKSNTTGLFTISYDATALNEDVATLPDSIVFVGDRNPPRLTRFSLLDKNKDCFNVVAQPNMCPSKELSFSSTGWWNSAPGNLVSTNGLVFLKLDTLTFPVSLSIANSLTFFNDFRYSAQLALKKQPAEETCQQVDLTEAELQYTMTNDVFSKDFLSQYNKITPDWFDVALTSPLANTHPDNIRTFLWTGERIQTEAACNGASVEVDGLYFVYLHHEKITLNVNKKTIIMETKHKFCFLIDVCKEEPQLIVPRDNYGKLETIFSFTELQAMGWLVQVKSIGFRNSKSNDGRKCSSTSSVGSTGKQVVFGSTNMTYNPKRTTLKGDIQGDLVLNVNNKNEILMNEQCFDGKSRFDTSSWFTADYIHKRYTKVVPVHNKVDAITNKGKSGHQSYTVRQHENSIFKMKTGRKQVLQTTNSRVDLRMLYREKKKLFIIDEKDDYTALLDDYDNIPMIEALEGLGYPLDDLITAMDSVTVDIPKFEKFKEEISNWKSQLDKDVEDLYNHEDDKELILKTLKTHFFKLTTTMIQINQWINELKAQGEDDDVVQGIKDTIPDLKASLKDLEKYVKVEKPTKEFDYAYLSLIGKLCLYSPCIEDVNATLYPMSYDLKLGDFCYDATGRRLETWQTKVSILKSQKAGEFFDLDYNDKVYMCLNTNGVKKALLDTGLNILGTNIRGKFILNRDEIQIPTRPMKLQNKYLFNVNNKINLKLKNWNQIRVSSYGSAPKSSSIYGAIKKEVTSFANSEWDKIVKRLSEAKNIKESLINNISTYEGMVMKDESSLQDAKYVLGNATHYYMKIKRKKQDAEDKYNENRKKMEEIERRIKDVCHIKTCNKFCSKLPKCIEERKPYFINVSIPECHTEVKDRSYPFKKSEEKTCSYQVKDRYYKPTGNCKRPNIDPKEAKQIIEQLKNKDQKTLTEQDAFQLMRIDFKQGEKLLKAIQKKNFFVNLPRRIELGIVTEEEFKKLEQYKDKPTADKMRNIMIKIQNGKTLRLISEKLNSSQTLTKEDYAKLKKIDPQIEKKIRVSEAVADLRERIDLKGGKFSRKDVEHLKEVSPELAKKFTDGLAKQKKIKECIDKIQKKIGSGTLRSADLKELEKISPETAEKLKKALREQLKLKIEKMHGHLKSVKGVLDKGMNQTGTLDIDKQLQKLTGHHKPITEKSLKELQEKLRNSTHGGIYDQVLARLDLDYDIKNITGNSEDLKRVLQHFFGVLTKIDVETIMQHNFDDASRELKNVQDWFFALSKIVTQACTKNGTGNKNNDKYLLQLLDQIKAVLGMFNNNLCKKKWTKGSKTVKIKAICTQLDKIKTPQTDICKQVKTTHIEPINYIVNTWKEIRKGLGSSEQQFTQSDTTRTLLDAYMGFRTNLKKGYAKSFGAIEIPMLSNEQLIAATEKILVKGYTTSLAQFELLMKILDDVKTFILNIPKVVEQNKRTTVEFDASRTNLIKVNYKQLTNELIFLLNNRCTDKSPDSSKLKLLIQMFKLSEMRLSGILASKKKDELYSNANRFLQFIGTVKKVSIPVWKKLLPCQLKQEKIHSDSKKVTDESTKELETFLNSVKALSTKSVGSYLTQVKDLLKKYEKDGIKSPIGKYIDHVTTFIEKLPKFNIAVMVSVTPDLSTVLLNTFENVIRKIEEIFTSIVKQLQRCGTSCKPEDIFGKENLIELSNKLDSYFGSVSKSTSDFRTALTFAPRGLAPIKNGLEFVQMALQTLSQSGTGFGMKGIENIKIALDRLNAAVSNMKDGHRDELYNSIAGKTNKDVQNYKGVLEDLKATLLGLYEKSKSKLDFVKSSINKVDSHIKKTSISADDIKKFISPIEQRFQFALDCGKAFNEIGELFKSIYSSKLDSTLLKYVNGPFAKNMSIHVNTLKENCKRSFLHTRNITIVMGTTIPAIKEKDFLHVDFSQKIEQLSKSSGTKRALLLKEFSSLLNKASKELVSKANEAKTMSEKVIGSISKTINAFESFKQNMKVYGDMYDKIQATIKDIKKNPVSEIGVVKDSLHTLLGSFRDYNLNKILLADSKVIPRKVNELLHLFKSTSGTLTKMNTVITTCKGGCSVEKVFGYSFLHNTTSEVTNWFRNMHEKLRNYTSEISGKKKELQTLKKTTKDLSDRFTEISQKKPYTVNTLKELSKALDRSDGDFKVILNATQDITKVLLQRDVNLDIIGSAIDSIVSQLSAIMNNHKVLVKGERLLLQAKKLKDTYGKLRSATAEFNKEGPLGMRLKFAGEIAKESNTLIQELPTLFELSNDTLQAAGVNSTWLKKFANNAVRLATLTRSIYNKTSHVLKSAEVLVSGAEQVEGDTKDLKKDVESFVKAPWHQKITAARNISKSFGKIFDTVIDTSLKSAAALGSTLTRDDLKSKVATAIGEKRLKKYQDMYHSVTTLALELQKGPISSMGVLSDSVNDFVQKMSGYDFGKMILHDPSSLETKFTEFRQLAQLAGSVLNQIGSLATSCKTKSCDTRTLFGSTFISSIAEKVSSKLTDIGRNFTTVSKRVKEGFQGWKSLVETSNGIAKRFHDIRQGPVTKDTFKKLSDALVQTADETEIFTNSSKKIFHAIFNEGDDMTALQGHFEDLLGHVRTVFNKTSRILPKVGEVFETAHDIRDSFDIIKTNLSQVSHGPIEARLEIAQKITQSISQLGKTLPLLLNQSDSLIGQLGVNSTWFSETAGKMADVAESLTKVMNKTNLILHGAESVVKDGKEMHSLVTGIKDDFRKIGSAPWKDKLKVMDELLTKQGKLLDKTSSVTGTIQKTLNGVFDSKLNISGGVDKVTHDLTGSVKILKTQVEKLEVIQDDVTKTFEEIKSGPVQKVGQLTDSAKDFVKSLKNYDIVDILLNTPTFAKEKLGELKDIVRGSGEILKSIDGLVTKHCPACNISTIFRSDFAKNITKGFSKNLRNVTHKLEGVLDKIESGATDLKGIKTSIQGLRSQVSRLDHLDLSKDGFRTVSSVLHTSSDCIQNISKDSSHVFRLLVNDSSELQKMTTDFGDFITDMKSFLDKAGNFTGSIADAFDKFNVIKKMFKDTKTSLHDVTHGPLQGRLAAVKGVAEGISSIMSGFTDLLKTSTIPIPWIKTLGLKLDKVTGGMTRVLNRTSEIATGLGETVGSIGDVIQTGKTIRSDFDKLIHSGSIGSKLAAASSIVTHVYNLTTHVNDAAGKAVSIFDKRSNKTLAKTQIFGDRTQKLLGDFSTAIKTVSDRYEKFNELSKSIQKAFDSIRDDPIKFATEELPKLFNQSAEFISLIHDDVLKIATKIGVDIDKFHIDPKIVNAARSFYKFATSALNAIGTGKELIVDFKNLLHSKSFTQGMFNLKKMMTSSEAFLKSIDQLGGDLFKNWDQIRGSFKTAVQDIAKSTGLNFEKMGSYLRKGLDIGVHLVNIYGSVKDLIDIKWNHLDFETILRATTDVLTAVQSGVEIAKLMGLSGGSSAALGTAAEVAGIVASIYQIYQGVKVFTAWLKDHCDITYKQVEVVRTVTEVCLKSVPQRQHVLVPIETCYNKPVSMIRGYHEATLNCNATQCIYMQDMISGYHEATLNCNATQCIYMQDVNCLKFNDECQTNKTLVTQELKGILPSIKEVYNSFHKYDLELRVCQIDIKNSELQVKNKKMILEKHTAQLLIAKLTFEKNDKMLKIMNEQQKKLEKIFNNGKVGLDISLVEFNVTSYHPNVNVIPFRVTAKDSNGHKHEVDIAIDFNKEKESLKNYAQLIISSFVNYVPLVQYRIGARGTKRPLTSEKGVAYWHQACIHYTEVYDLLTNTVDILDVGIRRATDNYDRMEADVEYKTPTAPSLTQAEATRRLLETIERHHTATTETVDDVIQRWRRTSQHMWSENIGTPCVGFNDCFDSQLNNLTALLEPEMEDYSLAVHNIEKLRSIVLMLINSKKLSKSKALGMTKEIETYLKNIDVLTHFCDARPNINQEMPLHAYAYEGGHFELACSIEGPASMKFVWKKNNHTLPAQTNWKLDLESVSSDDEGYYHCEGMTLTATVRSNPVLVEVFEAMNITTHPDDKVLEYPGNKDVTFHCNGTAQPEALYKWWFRRYTFGATKPSKPIVLSRSSVLTIKRANMKNSGQYWCELSNGYSSIYSRKAKLMVSRTQPKKEAARLTFDLHITTDRVNCALPTIDQSQVFITNLKHLLTNHIALKDNAATMNLIYKPNHENSKMAQLITEVGLNQKKNGISDSVSSALNIANKRDELHDTLARFMDELKDRNLYTEWNRCNVSLSHSSALIDWRADDLVCPRGMGLGTNLIECEQCSPGTFDDGKGECSPCPVGAYQEKGGQTMCSPCGDGMLTVQDASPSKDDCLKTDFICDHHLSLLIILDASTELPSSTWLKLKTFTAQLLRHVQLNDDAVKLSLVTVGNEAKIQIDLDHNKGLIEKKIMQLERQPGAYRHDLAYDVAKQISVSDDFTGSRRIVLFISQHQQHVTGEIDDLIGGEAEEMKSDGVKLYQLLINPDGADVSSYLSLVSRPVSEHFINVRNAGDVTSWSTVVARLLCSGTQ